MRHQIQVLCLILAFFVSGCSQPSNPVNHTAETGLITNTASSPTLLASIDYAGNTADLPETAKVFVFMRAKGTTMPLAVEQFTPAELPVQVGFSKPDPSVERVEAIARLSLTGAVMKHPNDLEVVSATISTDAYAQNLQLMIPTNAVADGNQSSGAALRIAVTLPESAELPKTAKLFVIAKMEDGLNPMPVAVKAYNINDIPNEIVLTDRDSMTSVARLSRHKRVEIIARISQSGATKKQPGDWESMPQIVDTKFSGLTQFVLTEIAQ